MNRLHVEPTDFITRNVHVYNSYEYYKLFPVPRYNDLPSKSGKRTNSKSCKVVRFIFRLENNLRAIENLRECFDQSATFEVRVESNDFKLNFAEIIEI